MTDYDIKKGHYQNIADGKLKDIMGGIFGNVKAEGDTFVSAFGACDEVRATIKSNNSITIESRMKKVADVDAATMAETLRRWNQFLEMATGMTTKERKKRMTKIAKV
ncbi:MAG: DUF5611 family protein [Euryarchaeota archaeon]|nr:DUF5611 family protein [Euryarchaeota archaeon]